MITKWEEKFAFKHRIESQVSEVRSVNIGDLLGALVLFGGLVSLSIAVAVTELIIFRNAYSHNPMRLWKWMNIVIDGDRNFFLYDSVCNSQNIARNYWK